MRVCVTIPAFNEEHRLRDSVNRLHHFLQQRMSMDWEIVIAENGSTDGTAAIADALTKEFPKIFVNHFKEKGRGGALKRTWLQSEADILTYMDADLSSDLETFPALIESLAKDGHDLATGSRLLRPKLTTRSFKREFASRCYNILVKAMLGVHFSDAQCGFKAITSQAAGHLLPQVEDTGWFFDTELLVLGEKQGYRILDMPVKWVEQGESHVQMFSTAKADLAGLFRLRRKLQRETHGAKTRETV